MFEIDWKSRVPIYKQLVERIKELILKEVLKENEQLPSVRSLSKELTINPNTIQKAYQELEREGYIYSIPGKGNFVAPVKSKFKKIVFEAFFIGISKDELIKLIEEIEKELKGGDNS